MPSDVLHEGGFSIATFFFSKGHWRGNCEIKCGIWPLATNFIQNIVCGIYLATLSLWFEKTVQHGTLTCLTMTLTISEEKVHVFAVLNLRPTWTWVWF